MKALRPYCSECGEVTLRSVQAYQKTGSHELGMHVCL